MSNLHLATPPETVSRLRPRARRIRIPLALLGLLLVVVCALAFGTILTQAGQQHQVLVLSHPVDAGDVITASDLGLATVSTGTSGIAFITASNESTVIGRPAAVAMPAGAPLIAADLGSIPPPAGQAVVAVLIKPGDAPPSLAPGAAVWVVITTPATQSTGGASSPTAATSAPAPVAATVTAVDTPSDSAITQGVIVSLSLPSSDVQTVTTAAAAGNVSLALVPPGS
jgi:Flp pilus assembly protein CpaB